MEPLEAELRNRSASQTAILLQSAIVKQFVVPFVAVQSASFASSGSSKSGMWQSLSTCDFALVRRAMAPVNCRRGCDQRHLTDNKLVRPDSGWGSLISKESGIHLNRDEQETRIVGACHAPSFSITIRRRRGICIQNLNEARLGPPALQQESCQA